MCDEVAGNCSGTASIRVTWWLSNALTLAEPAVPRLILPESFVAVVHQLRGVFTRPSFESFAVLVSGWVHALGGHRLTDALRAAGAAAGKHYTSYYRFLSHGRWSLDELGLALFGVIVQMLSLSEVELVLDDTLAHRTGKNVALASMHADPALKKTSRGRLFSSYGHVFVVLAVHIRVPTLGKTGWALPLLFRLFEGASYGGQSDAPSDIRRRRDRERSGAPTRNRVRKTDRELVDGEVRSCADKEATGPLPEEHRRKKTEFGADLVLVLARRFPALRFRVLADHLYNGRSVLHAVLSKVDNVEFVTRGRPDAALYCLPGEQSPRRRGRPKIKGERLANPETWATKNPDAFEEVTVDIYGRQTTLRVASFDGMAYRSLPGRLLRYVIVVDPDGIYRTDYLIATNISLSPAEVVEAYARRWPLERTFQDCKQKLCVENTQVQLPTAVRRSVPLGMLVYTLVVLWYVTSGHAEAERNAPRIHDEWYHRKGRASFSEMLSALRRLSWRAAIVDLPSRDPPEQEIWAEYVERVVAAA